jgi:hypothetical protein
MEEVEKNLTSIDGVSEIQAISVSRVSMWNLKEIRNI